MYDYRDVDFWKTDAEPRLGAPVCTPKGIIFVSERRFAFDRYNVEFTNTPAMSSLAAPVMLADGSVRCIRACAHVQSMG
jgi:hypothetical protein